MVAVLVHRKTMIWSLRWGLGEEEGFRQLAKNKMNNLTLFLDLLESGSREEDCVMSGQTGRLTYVDLERLVLRARLNGQEGLAFHFAMGRDELLREEFGSCVQFNTRAVEEVVKEQLRRNDNLRTIAEGDRP